MAVMAVIFDFDDTLLPDSTSALLSEYGIDPAQFWANDAQRLVEQGFDPPLAYLNLLLDEVRPGGRLEGLTNDRLRDFGAIRVRMPRASARAHGSRTTGSATSAPCWTRPGSKGCHNCSTISAPSWRDSGM